MPHHTHPAGTQPVITYDAAQGPLHRIRSISSWPAIGPRGSIAYQGSDDAIIWMRQRFISASTNDTAALYRRLAHPVRWLGRRRQPDDAITTASTNGVWALASCLRSEIEAFGVAHAIDRLPVFCR